MISQAGIEGHKTVPAVNMTDCFCVKDAGYSAELMEIEQFAEAKCDNLG
jgi:hypothetical protein